MKQFLTIILMFVMVLPAIAHRNEENHKMLMAIGAGDLMELESYDTIVNRLGYGVRCIGAGPKIDHIGLNLFNDEIKASVDKKMLDFVETALLAKILGIETNRSFDYKFHQGGIADIKNISPETPCKISNLNSRYLSFEWDTESGKLVRLDVPLSYDFAKEGTRAEIESELINRIKNNDNTHYNPTAVSTALLSPYKDDIYVLPGQQYLNEEINRNLYFSIDEEPVLVKSLKYPIESMANLILQPTSETDAVGVKVKVLKHELGETEEFTATMAKILTVCQEDGCIPYWGVETYLDGILSGSLFLYNWRNGYSHVLQVECKPEDILQGNGEMSIRASLFVPTNNIQTLFEPI